MTLKQIIRNRKILESGAVNLEFTIPGEPLIYSIKHTLGQRHYSVQHFRNKCWYSFFKCMFRQQTRTHIPVVLIIRFYVTPFNKAKVSPSELQNENVPAVFAYELCDYLLSFMEMLLHVLIHSYKQIVYIDAKKFYSNDPRTVFQFMRYDEYKYIKDNPAIQSKAQRFRPSRKVRYVQSKQQRDE
jgi:hypothetical protein